MYSVEFINISLFHVESMTIPGWFHGMVVESTSSFHIHSIWILYWHSIWNDGKVMEYDHSRWIPYGIKVEWNHQNEWNPSQNIFHMEWMESTWNYMEFIWNPYGFHVEYGGRVKTSYSALLIKMHTEFSESCLVVYSRDSCPDSTWTIWTHVRHSVAVAVIAP